jgi:hypothetical protein
MKRKLPSPGALFARGEGSGMRVSDMQITFLGSNLHITDPHPYPSPKEKRFGRGDRSP